MERRDITASVWVESARAPMVARALAHAGISPLLAGSPERGQSPAVAKLLSCDPVDDLRQMLIDTRAEAVVIASPADFGRDRTGADARALMAARARGVRAVCLEPIPASALDLAACGWVVPDGAGPAPIDAVRLAPLLRLSRVVREAHEAFGGVGRLRAAIIQSLCGPSEATLGARLFDAVEAATHWMGEPEIVHAVYVPASGLSPAAPESLALLRGELLVHARCAGGAAVSVVASDQASRWHRGVTMLGEGGRLTIEDSWFAWESPGGEVLDSWKPRRARDAEALGPAAVATGDALAQLLDPRTPDSGPAGVVGTLAVCQAALLSARTGQPESPATIRRMLAAG